MARGGPSPSGDSEWDVVVLGGGPAGSAAALAIQQQSHLRVCVVEAGRHPHDVIGESIPPDARLDLERLGAWDSFAAAGHQACSGSCSAWGSDELGYNDFVLNPYGPGWHLDRARFNRILLDDAVARGATLIIGTRFVASPRTTGRGHTMNLLDLQIGTTRTVTARFVVDATGQRASFARAMGAKRLMLDRLSVVCGYFDTGIGTPLSRLTLLEAEREGWWYAAAIPNERVIVAFATDADTVKAASLTRPHNWLSRCLKTRHLAPRLDGCRLRPGSLTIRAATSSVLCPAAGAQWFAVGDSAATYDPISGQGIQKALADGYRVATAVGASIAGEHHVQNAYAMDTESAFRTYEQTRRYFYALEKRWPDSSFWPRRLRTPDHFQAASL